MARRRSLKASQNEQKVQAALTNVSKGKFKTAYGASKAHGTSTATLYRRLNGGLTRAQAREAQQILTRYEEKALIVWLTMMSATGNPVSHSFVREMAEEIRQKRLVGINDEYVTLVSYPPISKSWTARFLLRYPFMKATLSRSIEAARVKEVSEELVLEFFETLTSIVEEYDIQLKDIYNMDETGLTTQKLS
jgi:Tc5 transposase DNA-binding domain